MRVRKKTTILDWFGIGPSRQRQAGRLAEGAGSEFINTFLPLSADYYHPLNAIFTAQITRLSMLNRKKTWFLRDGTRPLENFFARFPEPGDLRTRLLICHELREIVPAAWSQKVAFYELVALRKPCPKPGKLLVIGIWGGNARADVARFERSLKRAPRRMLRFSCIWPRWSGPRTEEGSGPEFPGRMKRLGFRAIGSSIFFTLWNLADYEVIDVSSNDQVCDRMTSHYVLSRGGRIQGVREVPEEKIDIRLSPHHGFRLLPR